MPEEASAEPGSQEVAHEAVEELATCQEHWMVLDEAVAEVRLASMQGEATLQSAAAPAELRCKAAPTSAQGWRRAASAGCQDSP